MKKQKSLQKICDMHAEKLIGSSSTDTDNRTDFDSLDDLRTFFSDIVPFASNAELKTEVLLKLTRLEDDTDFPEPLGSEGCLFDPLRLKSRLNM